jgi:hypothetical protein
MHRPSRRALLVWLAGVLAGVSGCGQPPGKPNPDLKVPDVPPGGRGSKQPAEKDQAPK